MRWIFKLWRLYIQPCRPRFIGFGLQAFGPSLQASNPPLHCSQHHPQRSATFSNESDESIKKSQPSHTGVEEDSFFDGARTLGKRVSTRQLNGPWKRASVQKKQKRMVRSSPLAQHLLSLSETLYDTYSSFCCGWLPFGTFRQLEAARCAIVIRFSARRRAEKKSLDDDRVISADLVAWRFLIHWSLDTAGFELSIEFEKFEHP